MKKTAKAKINWIPFTEGGRKQLPSGPKYSTVIYFEDDNSDRQEEAWSIVVDFDENNIQYQKTIATIWFLAYDNPDAPTHFFKPGSKFELIEGRKVVAQGLILPPPSRPAH